MKWAFYEPSIWKRKGLKLLDSFPLGRKIRHEIYPGRAEERKQLGLTGFSVLRKEASVVIPDVVRIMNAQRTSPDWPMLILRCLGDEGIPALVQVITNTSNPPEFRACATKYVEWEATNSGWAVEPLVGCLQEKDPELVAGIARDLGALKQEPEIAVPALTKKLQDFAGYVRFNAAWSLGEFGSAARSAMPALVDMLNDPDIHGRKVATNAIKKIAPEVLTNRAAHF